MSIHCWSVSINMSNFKSELNVEGIVDVIEVSDPSIAHGHHNPLALVKSADSVHFLLGQAEVKHFCVFCNFIGKDRLWEQSHAPLYVPPDDGLGGALAVLHGNPHQHRVLQDARPAIDKRRVGRNLDASLLAESDKLLLGKEGMNLDLKHGRLNGAFVQ